MAIPTWSMQQKAKAKALGAHLLKIEMNGRYATTGPYRGGSVGMAAVIESPAEAVALAGIVNVLCGGKVPEAQREEATKGMLDLLEKMLAPSRPESKLAETMEMLRDVLGATTRESLVPATMASAETITYQCYDRNPSRPCTCKNRETAHKNNPTGHAFNCPRWGSTAPHRLDENPSSSG